MPRSGYSHLGWGPVGSWLEVAMILFALFACEDIRETRDILQGVTERRVAAGLVLDVVPPEDPALEGVLDAVGAFAPGTVATAFLALAENPEALEDIPFTEATVTLSDGGSSGALENQDNGSYLLTGGSELVYEPGRTWSLQVEGMSDSGPSSAELSLPEGLAAAGQVPWEHAPGQPVPLAFEEALDVDQVAVVVFDSAGTITWSNHPSDIQSVYGFTHGAAVRSVEIPGEAFPGEDVYAVGIAGLALTEATDLEGLNTLLSSVAVGRMTVHPVSTITLP